MWLANTVLIEDGQRQPCVCMDGGELLERAYGECRWRDVSVVGGGDGGASSWSCGVSGCIYLSVWFASLYLSPCHTFYDVKGVMTSVL